MKECKNICWNKVLADARIYCNRVPLTSLVLYRYLNRFAKKNMAQAELKISLLHRSRTKQARLKFTRTKVSRLLRITEILRNTIILL